MKIVLLALLGMVLGAIVGGAIGVGAGFLWVQAFNTTSFEGYSGMLVFFTFMPIGIIGGALIGGVALGLAGARESAKPTS
jgi:hypothetical protein